MDDAKTTRAGKATIRTVAADAGVSVAAVSKVLRDAYGVSDELRGKVLKSIEKLDYRPSTAARGMRGRTFSIGILLVEMRNPFLPTIIDGVKEVLAAANYQAMIGVGEAKTTIDSMIDMKMDGVLLIAPRLSGEMLTRYATQIPMAVIGHHEPGAGSFDTVNSDDRAGARVAVEALIADGRRDIHMISLNKRNGAADVYVQREVGYMDAMKAAGLTSRTHIWRLKEREGERGDDPDVIFGAARRPEAVFCWSDKHAVDLLNEARMRGLDVPGEMAIIGYDNSPVAALPLIGLSSMDQRGQELGGLAARTLLSRIGGRDAAEHVLVESRLVRRTSA